MNNIVAAFLSFLTSISSTVTMTGQQVENEWTAWYQGFQAGVAAAASPAPSPEASPSPSQIDPSPSPAVVWTDPPASPVSAPIADSSPDPTATPSAAPSVTEPIARPWTPAPSPSVWDYPSPTPSPIAVESGGPVPVLTPSPLGTIMPAGVTYSSTFVGNTPFHHRVDTLRLFGATVLSQTVANNLWAQGFLGTSSAQLDRGFPIWVATSTDPAYSFQCTGYGVCGANRMTVNFPSGASAQCIGGGDCNYDHHITSFAPSLGYEVDGWGNAIGSYDCLLSGGAAHCYWGAKYLFSGSGLSYDLPNPQDAAVAAGYAIGLGEITYLDWKAGPLNHAFTLVTACEMSSPVYPSHEKTDAVCSGSGNEPVPTTSYGDLVALKSNVDPSTLTADPACLWLLQGFQRDGAYVQDNSNGYGIDVNAEPSYDLPANVRAEWRSVQQGIAPNTCLARVPAADVEVLQLNQAGTKALPPIGNI